MKKFLSIIGLTVFVFLSAYFSYQLSYFIGEKYFFDKLLYKKSVKHGYIDCWEGCEFEKFGKRAEDIQKIYGKSLEPTNRVLGERADDTYIIAVIGDSITWGVGVRENEAVPALLEKKLSKFKKTKVLQLGFPADDFLENYIKYKLIQQTNSIDLYVFIIVENDLLFNREGKYDIELYQKIISECTGLKDLITYNYYEGTPGYNYTELVYNSFNNSQNLCVFEKTASLYPKNSIFFDPNWLYSEQLNIYAEGLKKEGLKVLFTEKARAYSEYYKYWEYPNKYFRVSEAESHPSKIAHEMYADLLFEEITSNPKWGF
jgi:hypothetical protein